jgi:hypothetical protein
MRVANAIALTLAEQVPLVSEEVEDLHWKSA